MDVNAAILETAQARVRELGFENIQFIAGDARTLDVGGDFDAVVGRLVLMYMSDPAEALKQLTRHLRPGGVVAFQEVDFTPYVSISRSDTPLMNKLVEWGIAVFQHSGAHTEMGMDLHRTFLDAGLSAPVLHFVAPLGAQNRGPGTILLPMPFAVWSRLWRSLELRLLKRSMWIHYQIGFEKRPEYRNAHFSCHRM